MNMSMKHPPHICMLFGDQASNDTQGWASYIEFDLLYLGNTLYVEIPNTCERNFFRWDW
jgi:hypothetical protein